MAQQLVADQHGPTLRLVAVGGFGRVGLNCLVMQQGGDRLVIDCGVAFGSGQWGVDVYRPRFDALREPTAELRAVVLTHGHEDHLGAVPELLAAERVPVWGPPYALELCRRKLCEQFGASESFELRSVAPGDVFEVGSFRIEAIRTAHSTVDSLALAVHTVAGLVVHSGDFKLDVDASSGVQADEERLGELGSAGVRLLLSDSTNSCESGRSGKESSVADALERVIAAASGRVVVGLFASNVERLHALGHIARRHGRQVCLLGRSVNKHAEVASALGWLDWPSDLVLSAELARDADRARVLYVATGTQGEAHGALRLLADGSHPALAVEAGDTVVLSSRVIAGQELAVQGVVDGLLRRGTTVHTRQTDGALHVSGHACRDEQRQLIRLLQPELFVPMHGTHEQLVRHVELARAEGVGDAFVLDEGDALDVTLHRAERHEGSVAAGPVAVCAGHAMPESVLHERQRLGRAGVVCVSVVPLSATSPGRAPGRNGLCARIQLMGVSADPALSEHLEAVVSSALVECCAHGHAADAELEQVARTAVHHELRRQGLSRPTVLVTVARLRSV